VVRDNMERQRLRRRRIQTSKRRNGDGIRGKRLGRVALTSISKAEVIYMRLNPSERRSSPLESLTEQSRDLGVGIGWTGVLEYMDLQVISIVYHIL
jgi:hypothetical protein